MKLLQVLQPLFFTTICLLCPIITSAQSYVTPLEQDTSIIVGRLVNGLTYIIRHNELPKHTADFYFASKVGSVLEEDNQDGLAHFIEHMAFNGTKHFPGQSLVQFLERIGVHFGENINAYTSFDETIFNLDAVPTTDSAIVDSALLILHDWSGFLSLDPNEIEKERGVVREEWRTTASADRRMYMSHMAHTMPGTPYAVRDIIGDTAVINNFTPDELRRFYRTWYRPDLQAVIVVGDIDPLRIEQKIIVYWQDIPAPQNPKPRPNFVVPVNSSPLVSVTYDPEATRTSFQVQFRYQPVADSIRNTVEYVREQIACALCEEIMNNRFSDLTIKGAPFTSAYLSDADLTPTLYAAQFVCTAKDGQSNDALFALFDEIEKLRRYGVNPTELRRAKNTLLATYDNAFQNRHKTQTDSYIYDYYNAFLTGDVITSLEYDCELINVLTPDIDIDDVNRHINMRMAAPPVFLISAMQSDTSLLSADDYVRQFSLLAFKDEEPYPDKEIDSQLVKEHPSGHIVAWNNNAVYGSRMATLSNGLHVYFFPTENSDNQILIGAYSRGGYSTLPADHVSSAMLASDIQSYMGLANFSRPDLSKALSAKDVDLSTEINLYTDEMFGSCSNSDLESLLQMFYLSFAPPRRDDNAYRSYMTYLASQLSHSHQDPDNIFQDTLLTIAADSNPYLINFAHPSDLDSVTLDKVLSAYSARFSSARGFDFAVIGSFHTDSIAPLVADYLGALAVAERSHIPAYRHALYPQRNVHCRFSVPMQTPKTFCSITYSAPYKYSRKEALALRIFAALLDFCYHDVIREEIGASYGVEVSYSHIPKPINEYQLTISFDTDTHAFDQIYPIIEKEIVRIATHGPRPDNLANVRTHLIKKRQEDLQQNEMWLSHFRNYFINDLDLSHFERLVNDIRPRDIQRWARRILNKSHKLIVIMDPDNQ